MNIEKHLIRQLLNFNTLMIFKERKKYSDARNMWNVNLYVGN